MIDNNFLAVDENEVDDIDVEQDDNQEDDDEDGFQNLNGLEVLREGRRVRDELIISLMPQ